MPSRSAVVARALATAAAGSLLGLLASGCSSASEDGRLGKIEQALTTYGDWSAYGDGQCVIGAQIFYKAKFGVTLQPTGLQTTDVGACKYLGACMYWVSTKVEPDPTKWDRIPWGTETPKLYDLVIYPPSGSNPYGHAASVDHMEGTDPKALSKMYVMDSNYTITEKKSPSIHTTSVVPYGFFRLKSQRGPFCTPGWAPVSCGDQAGIHDADKDTLYRCDGITAVVVEKCAFGCTHATTGKDDACAPDPVAPDAGALDAVAEPPDGAADSGLEETSATADAAPSPEAGAPGAAPDDGELQSSIGCSLPRRGGSETGGWALGGGLASLAALGSVRARRRRR